ncbi:unnamed protein product [Phaeothamnion confervicola]
MVLGRTVTKVIAGGIADTSLFEADPAVYAYGMVCALATGGVWQLWACYAGFNVSATQSIIGGIIGFSFAWGGARAVNWATPNPENWPPYGGVVPIVLSWVLCPIFAGAIAAIIFATCRAVILRASNGLRRSYYVLPFAVLVTAWLNVFFVLEKGALKKLQQSHPNWTSHTSAWVSFVAAAAAAAVSLLCVPFFKRRVAALPSNTIDTGGKFQTNRLLSTEETSGRDVVHPSHWRPKQQPPPPDQEMGQAKVRGIGVGEIGSGDDEKQAYQQPHHPESCPCRLAATDAETTADEASPSAEPPCGMAPTPTHARPLAGAVEAECVVGRPRPAQEEPAPERATEPRPTLKGRTKAALLKGTTYDIFEVIETDPVVRAIHSRAEKFDPRTELVFSFLQVFSAICVIFAHGAAEVGYAAGPLNSIWQVVKEGSFSAEVDPQTWILAYSAAALVIGLATYGYNVMRAMGSTIAMLSPARGFAAELATSTIILMASQWGLPTSSSQAITGAIIGVGLLEGVLGGVNWRFIIAQLGTWVGTIVVCGLVTAALFAQGIYAPCPSSS